MSASPHRQQQYWRQKKRKSRGAADVQTPERSNVSAECETDDSGPSSSKRGRPPLGDIAMTPGTYSTRKGKQNKKNYRSKKTTATRKAAVNKRWQVKLFTEETSEPAQESDAEPNEKGAEELAEEDVESAEEDVESADEDVLPMEDEESAEEGEENEEDVPKRTQRFHQMKLRRQLTKNPLQNLDIFIHYCKSCKSRIAIDCTRYNNFGNLDSRQMRYRAEPIIRFIKKLSEESADKLLLFWITELLKNNMVKCVFEEQKWDLPEKYMPIEYKVERVASSLEGNFLKRDRTTNAQRILGTQYVAEVVTQAGLSTHIQGHITLLSKYTNCSRKFAKSVMEAVESDNLNDFMKRSTRADSIHADRHWTDLIAQFVLKPENARAVPGKETVSIKYGVRRPKYLLRKTRATIAAEFLSANPTCPYKSSTIMREFPQNAVTASSKDKKRNSCPYHCNARRIIQALHMNDTAKEIPISCRGMSMLHMCPDESIEANEPTQWNRECAAGRCKQCPVPEIDVTPEKAKKVISFSLWEYGVDEIKKKKQEAKAKEKELEKENENEQGKKKKKAKTDGKVFGLFKHAQTIEETISMFLQMLTKLKSHVYNSYCQWNARFCSSSRY